MGGGSSPAGLRVARRLGSSGVVVKLIRLVTVLCCVFFADLGRAAEPARGNWRWPAALAKVNAQAAAAAAGCVVWVEAYDVSSYRSWIRCGVAATSSGFSREEIHFGGWSGTTPKTGSDQALYPAGSGFCNFGTGLVPSICNAGNITGGVAGVVTGFDLTFDTPTTAGALGHASGPGKEVYYKHVSSCTGAALTGSVAEGPYPFPGATFFFGLGGNKTRGTNTGSIGPQCRAADVLGTDFGPIASDCTSGLTVEARLKGSLKTVGDCSCIPRGQAIVNGGYFPPNTCVFVPITGDPGGIGTSDGSPGDKISTPGHTFTNQDLAGLPSGEIPTSGGAGFPDGRGLGATAGGTAPAAGPAGSGTGLGGSGSGTCPVGVANCNEDGTPDAGVVPGIPSFDGTIGGAITEDSPGWVAQIQSFVAGSPVVAAISGSGLTASGSCNLAATVMGASVDLGFCNIPASFFTVMSAALLLLSHLVAFFIIFR